MSIAAEDLEEIRQLARSVATERIAPAASDVDEAGRFLTEGYQALVESQLHAAVIPGPTATSGTAPGSVGNPDR